MATRPAARFLERLATWLPTRADLDAALLVGSQARASDPADRWSDVDIVLIAQDPARYLDDASWLTELGSPVATFVEPTLLGQRERRVLFADGLDADFSVISREAAERFIREQGSEVGTVFRRGVVVLHDRPGTFGPRIEAIAASPPPRAQPPDQREFDDAVADFWYHALWSVRKLRRGELWLACECVNGSLQAGLLRQLRWLALASGAPDTWHGGRFLERWAAPDVVARLADTLAPYDAERLPGSIEAACALFADVAGRVARAHGLRYPVEVETGVREMIGRTMPDDA